MLHEVLLALSGCPGYVVREAEDGGGFEIVPGVAETFLHPAEVSSSSSSSYRDSHAGTAHSGSRSLPLFRSLSLSLSLSLSRSLCVCVFARA